MARKKLHMPFFFKYKEGQFELVFGGSFASYTIFLTNYKFLQISSAPH